MKRNIQIALVSFLIISSTACKKAAPLPDTGKDLVLTADEQQIATADNSFNFKLVNNIAAGNGTSANLLLSPLSVSMAMAMTVNGSNGATTTAINNTMNFSGYTPTQLNSYYHDLITQLPQLDPNTTLKIANSIWYTQTLSVLPQFIKTNTDSYNAYVQSLDFTNPNSKNTINSWVNTQTAGKIPSIIDQILPNDRMYLINAIYFKSTWKERFLTTQTHSGTFYLADNSQVQTDYMTGKIDCNAYNDGNVVVVELPYSNSKYSMVIAMPLNNQSATDLAASTDQAKWDTWMSKLGPQNQNISLPKFKFSYDILLNNALIAMGMGNAFSDAADFSNISASGGLQITQVKHKTYIEVNEDGTEAAAVTSVGIGYTAALPNNITIDHPFMFAIREMKSGLILFTGIVNNPLN